MPLPLPDLEARVRTLLQTGHTLAVRWDCGNDESLLFVDLDGTELPFTTATPTTWPITFVTTCWACWSYPAWVCLSCAAAGLLP